MRDKLIKFFDFVLYWMIIILPFSMAVAPAPMNVFMGWLLFAFLIKKILRKESPFIQTPVNIPFLSLIIISLISMIHSVSLNDSIKGGILRLIQYGFLFLAITDSVKDSKHLRRIFISMILGVCFVSFDGIWQVVFGKDFVRGYSPVINIGLTRATASFKDSNVMGIYLSAIIPLIFGLTIYYFKKRSKVIMVLAGLLGLTGLALTYSRPSLLAVYISLLFLSIVKKNKLIISLLLILLFLAPFLLPKSVKEWAKAVDYNPVRFMCNDDRIAIYRNTLNMIKDHPVIGVGTNTFMKNYKKYKESLEYRGVITSDLTYAHNNFLHMAGEIGLLGLAVFLWLLYRLFKASAAVYNKLENDFLKNMSLALAACLIAFLVNGLTESSFYYSRVAMIFWYIGGLAVSLRKFYNA